MFLVLSSINGRSKRPEGGSYQLQVGQGEGKSILSLGIQRPDSPFSLYLVMEGILFLPLSFCCVCVCAGVHVVVQACVGTCMWRLEAEKPLLWTLGRRFSWK